MHKGTTTTTGFETWIEQNIPQSRRTELSSLSPNKYDSFNWPSMLANENNCTELYDKYEPDILNTLQKVPGGTQQANVFSYVGSLTGPIQIDNIDAVKTAFVRSAAITVLQSEGGQSHSHK